MSKQFTSNPDEELGCYSDYIGFLPINRTIKCDDFEFQVVDNHEETMKELGNIANYEDGYIYPQTQQTVKLKYNSEKKDYVQDQVIPNSKKPADLFKMPISHKLIIYGLNSSKEHRNTDAGILINLIGYLYGFRLQFNDWWIDMRVPFRKSTNTFSIAPIRKEIGNHFLNHAYKLFKNWEATFKRFDLFREVLINSIFLHNRAPSYFWDWESFTINYMVFDSLYYLSSKFLDRKNANDHGKTFENICKQFEIYYSKEYIDLIIRLRNEIFHQSIWNKGMPGTNINDDGFYANIALRRFNEKLIAAFFGYKNDFIKSDWTGIDHHYFEYFIENKVK